MARDTRKRIKTKHPGVYKRETTRGDKFDIKLPGNRWIYGLESETQAREERDRLVYEARFGRPFESKPKTFAAFVDDDWLPDIRARVAQEDLRSSTAYQYEHDVERHLRPAFRDTPLPLIDLPSIERFKNRLTASGQSNHSVLRILNTLSGILEHARRHRIIQHNPVRDVKKPKAKARQKPILLTPAQVREVANAAAAPDERRMILVAAYTGARISELFGLRWESVDVTDDGGALRIVEQFYRNERVDRPKTPTGAREIPFGRLVAGILREQALDGRYSQHGLVFPSPEGHYWHETNFNRRVWQRARAAAGFGAELKFHHLRHFHTTMMRGQGLPTAVTEQLLGHSDDRTHRGYTQQTDTYAQLVREASDRAFEVAP